MFFITTYENIKKQQNTKKAKSEGVQTVQVHPFEKRFVQKNELI